ncbi:acetyl-CoA carboxylase biotin carboxyl carrier protein [Paenibacillus sp.]|jgi:acetyl-CoA carboxylase biotin carboxyl carrier protein|uniref:acetyl-CoA carboxylase biotin carboxyl carrier protein n=1 Tax=Paenibacillus sp. TaxID=58172 RepID=UPI00281FECFB|nr:acetyl-CoA carboxylase biotin carboxyl carrier protein [Paenibacillus sp.]MDR0267045.1 acetyl-CoA carboxylase biotin carboxyl carrier protein [Paenibacillus sp.]
MLKLSEIKELIQLVDQTSVHELDIELEGTHLTIRKANPTEIITTQAAPAQYVQVPQQAVPQYQTAPAAAESVQPATGGAKAVDPSLHKIVSPMVGTFYKSPSPEAGPFVNVGDKVNEKSTVCIIEAMKLMNELEAEVKGEIVEILVENGQLVEFGQPLFLVKSE